MNKRSVGAGVVVLILVLGITAGYVLGFLTSGRPIVLQAGDYRLLDELKAVLQERYYTDLPSDKELLYGSAKGLTAALGDPWTEYFNTGRDFSAAKRLGRHLHGHWSSN